MAQRGSSSGLPWPIGLSPVDRRDGDGFSGNGAVRRGLAVGILVALLGGCVTTPKWKPGPTRVTTRVFDENGREVSGQANFSLPISPDPKWSAFTSMIQGVTSTPASFDVTNEIIVGQR